MSAMLRQASSRNHRNKGFKVKHILQICLLLAVCIWLLYQVKHSHDKKKAFDANNSKIADDVDSAHEMIKFGRKDLNRGVEALEDEKHGEEENEEDEEGKEEDNDLERGDGDDEIDENDQEKVDEAAERGEEFSDEDKGAREEENEESEEKNDHQVDAGSSENRSQNVEDRNAQEAREENYKGDDASSAVLRDNQVLKTEVDDERLRNSVEEKTNNATKNDVENDQSANASDNGIVDQEHSKLNAWLTSRDDETSVNKTSLNDNDEEKGSETVKHRSFSNLPPAGFDVQLNSTAVAADASSLQWKNETILDSTSDQKTDNEVGTTGLERRENFSAALIVKDSQELASKQTEKSDADSKSEESPSIQSQLMAEEQNGMSNIAIEVGSDLVEDAAKSNGTTETEEIQNAASEQKKEGLQKDEESGASTKVEASLTAGDSSVAVQGKSVDSSSSLVTHEEKDATEDLSTLPHVEFEGRNVEDVAVE